jgi:hypothetical protein
VEPWTVAEPGSFAPDVSGWVIEMWGRFGGRHFPSSEPERPVYWHGPDSAQASNLNASVAVFPTRQSAVESFRAKALPLPPGVSRWAAVSVEDAVDRGSQLMVVIGWGSGHVVPKAGPA